MPRTNLCRDENGFVLVLTAIALPMLVGLGALALDFGFALARTRQLQAAADAAAFNGASAIAAGFDPSTYSRCSDEVKSSAATSGFRDGVNGITVTPSCPESATTINGFSCGANKCVTAKIKEQRAFSLLGIYNRLQALGNLTGNLAYEVSATALITNVNQYCMLATANSKKSATPPYSLPAAVSLQGNVTINSPNCGIADNSSASNAFQTTGSSFTLNAPVSDVGGWSYNGNPPQFSITYGTPVIDPYVSDTALQNALNSIPAGDTTLSGCPTAGVHYRSV